MTDRLTGEVPTATDNRWFKYRPVDGQWQDARGIGFGAWAHKHAFTVESVEPTRAILTHPTRPGPISVELMCCDEIADEIRGIQAMRDMQGFVSVAKPDQWEARHGELAAQHELLKAQYQEMLDAAESAARDRQALLKQVDNLKAQVGELMRQRDAIASERDRSIKEESYLRKERDAHCLASQNAHALCHQLEEEKKSLLSQLAHARHERTEAQMERDDLRDECERLKLQASATKSLRDEFAMAALPIVLQIPQSLRDVDENGSVNVLVREAYRVADEAMHVREVQP